MSGPPFLDNHFLIATPRLEDPNFSRGVTFLCQHNEDGAMGLLINRLSEYRLGDVLAQMRIETDNAELADAPVLAGGPVQPERGFVLHERGSRPGHEWESSYRVSERLVLTTSRDILVAMAAGEGPRRALVALGYAGWGGGQLEAELAEDGWLTVPADERLLFDTPIDERWQAAARLIGIDLGQLAGYSGHA